MADHTASTRQTNVSYLMVMQQIERLLLTLALVGLMLTGIPQRFAAETWAETLIRILGGIESARILHRFFAILLLATMLYHALALGYRWFVLSRRPGMFPGMQDFGAGIRQSLHDLGLRASHEPSNYQFVLKFRYLLLVISAVLLALTGLILWNPLAVTNVMPGETIPVAQSIHSNQALLTTVALIILQVGILLLWRPQMPSSTADDAQASAPASDKRRRFWTVALPLAGLVIIALIWFTTSGETAITTVPRRQAVVFAPQAMPETGDARIGETLWTTLRCAFCHGQDAMGGPHGEPALRSTQVSFQDFYEQVRIGSEDMPAFNQEELPDGYMLHLWTWLTEQP